MRQQETRYRMVIKGITSIQHGDNPCIVEHALWNHYAVAWERSTRSFACRKYGAMAAQERRDEVKGRMQRPLPQPGFEELTEVMTGMAAVARHEGILPLEEIADAIEHETFLQSGLYLAVDGTSPEMVAEILWSRKEALVEEQGLRFQMIIEGVAAIQRGQRPDVLGAQLRALYAR